MSLFTPKSLLSTEDQIKKFKSSTISVSWQSSQHLNRWLVRIFLPFIAHIVSPPFVSASIACYPFASGTAAAVFWGGLLWQSSLLGCGSLSRAPDSSTTLKLLHRAGGMLRGWACDCRGGGSLQASRRQLRLGFSTADSWILTSPMATGCTAGAPSCTGRGVGAHIWRL